MPLKISIPLEETHVLERSDAAYGNDGEPSRVTVRQATQAQNEKRSHIYSEVTNVINRSDEMSAELQLRQHWSLEELKRMEVFLTMVDCNVLAPNDEPLFKFRQKGNKQVMNMTTNEFAEAFGKLPTDIASEIHSMVLKVNPSWDGPLGR